MQTIEGTQLLRDDHKLIVGLFRQLEAVEARAPEMRKGVTRTLVMELEIHMRIEEEIFYPALQETGDVVANELIARSRNEHAEAKQLLTALKSANWHNDIRIWRNTLLRLIQSVQLHIREEEHESLPLAERLLKDRLMEIGMWLKTRKAELQAEPQYRSAQPEVTQDFHGGEQMRKKAAG